MLGNRALYHRGWKAVTYHGTEGMIYDGITDPTKPFEDDQWELYHVAEDFSESRDLAIERPDKLRELQEMWWIEAARNNVLPVMAHTIGRMAGRPRISPGRKEYVYYPNGSSVEFFAAVNVKNRSHTITAELELPPEGAEGVLVSCGSRFGGYVLFVKDGRLRYTYNLLARGFYRIVSSEPLPTGPCTLGFEFEKTGTQPFGAGGIGRLLQNDKVVGEAQFPLTVPLMFGLGESLRVGYDAGAAVTDEYEVPFRFGPALKRLIIDVEGRPVRDLQQEAQIGLARQ
jgi:arylsulfatase